jgi:hypothetical protein
MFLILPSIPAELAPSASDRFARERGRQLIEHRLSRIFGVQINRGVRERELANLMATTLIEDLRNLGVTAYRFVRAISCLRATGCCEGSSFRLTRQSP